MKKALTIGGVSVVVVALVLGMALPALAAPDITIPWTEDFDVKMVRGEVTYVDEANQSYFTILSGEDEIRIRVDDDTKYFLLDVAERITTTAQERLRLSQHQNGAGKRLKVQSQLSQAEDASLVEPELIEHSPFGERADFSDIEIGDKVVVFLANGENLAKVVLIIKPDTVARVSGVITGVSARTIEITPDDGRPVTLRYDEDTIFTLHGFTSVEERQLARAVYDSQHMLAKRVVVYLPGD